MSSEPPWGRQQDDESSWITLGWVSYVLHLIVAVAVLVPWGQPSLLLLLLALLMDFFSRDSVRGTWLASHVRWRIRSVLIAGALYLLTLPLWLVLIVPGWLAWTVISLWFFYRIVKGMVYMGHHRPLEVFHDN